MAVLENRFKFKTGFASFLRGGRLFDICLTLIFILFPSSIRAQSHDSDSQVVLESTVKSVDWSATKLTMTLAVAAGTASTADWRVDGPAPALLRQKGWTSNDIKVGDKFSAIVAPDNTKVRTATLLHIVFNGGHVLSAGPYGFAFLVPVDGNTPDLMAGFYGNTEICRGASFECHVWYYPNHRFILFSRDLQKDGSWSIRGMEGNDWAEKVDGHYIGCMIFDARPMAPLCHSPLFFQKIGDHWSAYLANGTQESRSLIIGHQ